MGRQLARRLQLPFVDSDQAIELRLGCPIREFFEREGEARFREIEAEVIDALTQQGPGVLSTGGGAVLRAENRAHLRSRGRVIYLKSHPEELIRRLRHDTNRPLLQVADPMAKVPAETVMVPLSVLEPDKVVVPVPVLVKLPVPVIEPA